MNLRSFLFQQPLMCVRFSAYYTWIEMLLVFSYFKCLLIFPKFRESISFWTCLCVFSLKREEWYTNWPNICYTCFCHGLNFHFRKRDVLLVPGYKHSVYIFSRVEVIKPISQCIYCFKMYCQVILLVSKFAMYMYRNPKIKRVCLSKMQL